MRFEATLGDRSLFRGRVRSRAPAARKILGTPRRHEPCVPLARPGQDEASARTARSGIRLVYGRVRQALGVTSGSGHFRPINDVCVISAFHPIATKFFGPAAMLAARGSARD